MSKLISYLQLGGIAIIAGQLTYIIINNQTNITNEKGSIEQNTELSKIEALLQEINVNLSFVASTMGKQIQSEKEALQKTKDFMSSDKKWNPFKK